MNSPLDRFHETLFGSPPNSPNLSVQLEEEYAKLKGEYRSPAKIVFHSPLSKESSYKESIEDLSDEFPDFDEMLEEADKRGVQTLRGSAVEAFSENQTPSSSVIRIKESRSVSPKCRKFLQVDPIENTLRADKIKDAYDMRVPGPKLLKTFSSQEKGIALPSQVQMAETQLANVFDLRGFKPPLVFEIKEGKKNPSKTTTPKKLDLSPSRSIDNKSTTIRPIASEELSISSQALISDDRIVTFQQLNPGHKDLVPVLLNPTTNDSTPQPLNLAPSNFFSVKPENLAKAAAMFASSEDENPIESVPLTKPPTPKPLGPTLFSVKPENLAKAAAMFASSQEDNAPETSNTKKPLFGKPPLNTSTPQPQPPPKTFKSGFGPTLFSVKPENLAKAAAMFASSQEDNVPEKSKPQKPLFGKPPLNSSIPDLQPPSNPSFISMDKKISTTPPEDPRPSKRINEPPTKLDLLKTPKIAAFLSYKNRTTPQQLNSSTPQRLNPYMFGHGKKLSRRSVYLLRESLLLYGLEATEEWIIHHSRQLFLQGKFSGSKSGFGLLNCLIFRIWRETRIGFRSPVLQVIRGEVPIETPMVLKVISYSIASEGIELELGDGYYSLIVPAKKGILKLIETGRLKPGRRICIEGSSFFDGEINREKRQKKLVDRICLGYNNVRPDDNYKLGFSRHRVFPPMSVVAEGGEIPITIVNILSKGAVYVRLGSGKLEQIIDEDQLLLLAENKIVTPANRRKAFSFKVRGVEGLEVYFPYAAYEDWVSIVPGHRLLCQSLAVSSITSYNEDLMFVEPMKQVIDVFVKKQTKIRVFPSNQLQGQLNTSTPQPFRNSRQLIKMILNEKKPLTSSLVAELIAKSVTNATFVFYITENVLVLLRPSNGQSLNPSSLNPSTPQPLNFYLLEKTEIKRVRNFKYEGNGQQFVVLEAQMKQLNPVYNRKNAPDSYEHIFKELENDEYRFYKGNKVLIDVANHILNKF